MNSVSIIGLFISLLLPRASVAVHNLPPGRTSALLIHLAAQIRQADSHGCFDRSLPAASDDNSGDVEDDSGSPTGHVLPKSPIPSSTLTPAGACCLEFNAISPQLAFVGKLSSRAPPR